MPPAARVKDNHVCKLHKGGPVLTGCPTVLIGFQPAARLGDLAACQGMTDAIVQGSLTVNIGSRPAARLGDATDGGSITEGFPLVNIGSSTQADALRLAALLGLPFCEECREDGLSEPSGAKP